MDYISDGFLKYFYGFLSDFFYPVALCLPFLINGFQLEKFFS